MVARPSTVSHAGLHPQSRLAMWGVVALCGLAMATSASAALPPNKIYEKLAPSVWRVYAHDAKGQAFSQGSGIVISRDTVITNCHVVARGVTYSVRQDNQTFAASLAHADPERDMCQLSVWNFPAPSVSIGNSDKVGVGERIYALGNPRGMELTLSDGLVSALRKNAAKQLHLIQITAPISPGSSGGGVFDEEGNLIGITTLQVTNGQNLNLAIPINWLKELPWRSAAAGMLRFVNENKAAEAKALAEAKAAADAKTAVQVRVPPETKASIDAKAAAEAKAAADKIASDKAATEKAATEKIATEKMIAERIAEEKAAIEIDAAKRVAREREAIERESAARIAAERVQIEKSTAEKIAAERAAMAEATKRNIAPAVAVRPAEQRAAPSRPSLPEVPAAPYADINDVEKFKLVARGAGPEANYRRFLTYALPRAFAVSESGNTYGTWGLEPRDPSAPKEPVLRAILECERTFQRKCFMYAVDNVVVYRNNLGSNVNTAVLPR